VVDVEPVDLLDGRGTDAHRHGAAPDLGRERPPLRRESVFESRAPAIWRQFGRKMTAGGNHRAAGRRDAHSSTPATRNAPALQSRRSRRRWARSGPSPDSVVEPEPECRDRNGPAGAGPRQEWISRAMPFRASARFAPLPEGGGLADPRRKEVELRAPRHAVADDLDLLDRGLLTLNVRSTPTPEADPSHGQRTPYPTARQAQDGAFEDLDALAVPLHDLGADLHGVAGREGRDCRFEFWSLTISSSTFTGSTLLHWAAGTVPRAAFLGTMGAVADGRPTAEYKHGPSAIEARGSRS